MYVAGIKGINPENIIIIIIYLFDYFMQLLLCTRYEYE